MFCVHEREILGELMLNYPARITLPKSGANQLGSVFVPNAIAKPPS